MIDIPESTAKAIEVDSTALFFFSNSNPRFFASSISCYQSNIIEISSSDIFGNPAGLKNTDVWKVKNNCKSTQIREWHYQIKM